MATAPSNYAVGTEVTFIAGPTKVKRTGKVIGHEGQFVVVEVMIDDKPKTLKTRPGAIVS